VLSYRLNCVDASEARQLRGSAMGLNNTNL